MLKKMAVESEGAITAVISQSMNIEWKLRDFFSLPIDSDYFVSSPRFFFNDGEWFLRIYPNGYFKNPFIYFQLVKYYSSTETHLVTFQFGIHEQSTKVTFRKVEGNFNGNGSVCGRFIDMTRYDFFELKHMYQKNNVIKFFCHFEMKGRDYSDVSTQTISDEDILNHGAQEVDGTARLIKDFKNLLITSEDYDVIIHVKNQKFKVHKDILRSRCSAFSSMLAYDMKEKNSRTIDITDCEPDAFQHFLTFIYSGCVDGLSNDNVFNLYYIGDKYDAVEVKQKCIHFMVENISVSTFFQIITLALRHDESGLLETATDYFAKNVREIIGTLQWQSFLKQNPVAANELYIKALDYNVK